MRILCEPLIKSVKELIQISTNARQLAVAGSRSVGGVRPLARVQAKQPLSTSAESVVYSHVLWSLFEVDSLCMVDNQQ
jgi:hypothetical protein